MKPKEVLNVKELAAYLNLHPTTIYNYLYRGEIPAFKIGKNWRFNKKSIDRWCLDKEKETRQRLEKKRLK
jgi:excisionase family DNA binding protein